MRNNAYWANRMRLLEDALLDTGYDYVKNLEQQYDAAIRTVETELEAWYQRFAGENGITLAEARRMLTGDELAEFRWTVQDYIKHGRENAISQQWAHELENASARVHVSRLDSIKLRLQHQAEVLHGGQADALTRSLGELYERGYYHTAFEVQKGIGVGWSLHGLTDDEINKVLARPWTTDKQTFSDRIWQSKEALVNSVNTNLTQMIMRGAAPDKAIKAVAERFKVSKAQAGRLVMTESAAFASEARKDCFKDLGVEKYVIVGTLDRSTCELCGSLDGEVYPMSAYAVGSTAPPFHPWCRCCTAPYYADLEGIGDRAARDEAGGYYTVPKDMTYEEWAKETLEKPEKAFTNGKKSGTIISGAITGARNPYGREAEAHAERYYAFVRRIDSDIPKIAANTGLSEETVTKIKRHLFLDEHDLGDRWDRFEPDYMIAESWQRLMEGKDIKPHDLTLLRHEEMEASLMAQGLTQDEAHIKTSQKYNYDKEAKAFYAQAEKHPKE